MANYYPRCAKCKGTAIVMVASCEWDGELNEWIADEFHSDGFFCRDCDSDEWEYIREEDNNE
jgi:hypothetical protein